MNKFKAIFETGRNSFRHDIAPLLIKQKEIKIIIDRLNRLGYDESEEHDLSSYPLLNNIYNDIRLMELERSKKELNNVNREINELLRQEIYPESEEL